jgi:PAS domain-containing protein
LCFLDRNLRYVSLNQRLADLTGLPAATYIGKTIMEMVPELFPRLQRFLHRALKGEAIKGVEAVKPSPVRGKQKGRFLLSAGLR